MSPKATVDYDVFASLDIRLAQVKDCRPLEGARRPAYVLELDCGDEIGSLCSTAQITQHYRCSDLIGRRVLTIVNFPHKRVAGVKSQCLVLGVYDADGSVWLLGADGASVPLGSVVG